MKDNKKSIDNTFKNAKEKIEKENMELLGIKKVSNHPDDWYLCYVLADRGTEHDTYVTWLYNDSIKSLECGRYFSELDYATEKFNIR